MHLRFPFNVRCGTVTQATNDEWVLGLIEQVLFTTPGERVNRPQFGCGAQGLVFQPNSGGLASATQYLVTSELQRWLAGIAEIKSVVVSTDQAELSIDIEYVNLLTGASRQATLPRTAR
jgi:phage baseplate assembly protein W